MKPLKPVQGEPWRSLERYRFVADLNFDGYQDIALSMDKKFFGNAGGHFDIYIGLPEGKYKRIGVLFAHPMAVHISKCKSGAVGIISVYSRLGGSSGFLIKYSITKNGVSKIAIRPGDGGTDEGRSTYQRYFSSESRLKAEISITKGGTITWTNYP